MSKNQHIVEITIIWPDDKWEDDVESTYLDGCLEAMREHLQDNPIQNREEKRTIVNARGRVYAEIHISPCK